MVKSYLKYEHSKTFGLVTSPGANVVWTHEDAELPSNARRTGAGHAITAANEEVLCWDVKKGELLGRWQDSQCTAQVTALARSEADTDLYAVGYGDGSIRLWDSRLGTVVISFNGHKSGVTALVFDKPGVRLASGAQDTDIIIWDLVAEVGLYRLRGHKNQVTGIKFLDLDLVQGDIDKAQDEEAHTNVPANGTSQENMGVLLSVSKDALIKLWDLGSQHCIETHIAQSNGECWSMGVSPRCDGCITAGNDGELRIWSIDLRGIKDLVSQVDDPGEQKYLYERGTLYRQGKDRTIGVHFHPRAGYIAAHGTEKSIELWRIRSESEVQKSLARKRKRRREKAAGQGIADGVTEAGDKIHDEDMAKVDISELIVPYVLVRTEGKVSSLAWSPEKPAQRLQLLVATNNQIEVYNVPVDQKERHVKSDQPPDYERTFAVNMPGHRTDIRAMSLSSDDRMLASASNGNLKIWNVRTQTCIRTLECGYALCSAFLPGDKIVVVGNRNGDLELFDITSSTPIETIKAHEGPTWTLHVHPDGKSMVTGGADKSAKFWAFEIVQDEIPGSRRTTPHLKLAHKRTLKVSDDILSLRFSPDARLLAVATLDNTVKVFFVDSLKLFLNLYGHKLPVLNMDISFDSKLIVTCSADKNVRLWGLDFGDCHKAFFAHQDSIMQVAFVPHNQDGNGHHFFSASKDRMIKYWDGDKFEQIQRLSGHHGEIWAIAVSRTGDFLVTASHDKSIRVWHQTDEQLFLEEEREKELEELYENTLATSLEQEEEPGEEKGEVATAGKQTTETLKAGERIAEALEVGMEDLEIVAEWKKRKAVQPSIAPPQRNLTFMAFGNISAERHVLSTIEKIKAAALQDALLVLTFDRVIALFTFINIWAEKQWNIPLTCRVLFFMLKTHYRQIMASKTMRPMLDSIRGGLRRALQSQKDEMGFNLAALRFVGVQVRDKGTKNYVDEDTWTDEKIGLSGKKRAFVNVT
ncbi:MAG: hypothetical protein LQ340_006332 [Diploschistes diacapsis]|nr:MAG: hypothetical protein LQ340_006332 [Diploschistes diacapsis]